jgi:hypothetical protein
MLIGGLPFMLSAADHRAVLLVLLVAPGVL